MKLQNIEFGNILGASGVQGFFGEGYWFHHLFRPLGLDLDDITFVAKTVTLQPRLGNMTLIDDYIPDEIFPDSIKVRHYDGLVLNAVGLSNPGLQRVFDLNLWQQRKQPFFLSIMSLADTKEGRLAEIKRIVGMIGEFKTSFSAPFGVQINLSCPNTDHDPCELIEESASILEVASTLQVPLMPKFSIASAPIPFIMELNDNPNCNAICVSNTLPFGWEKLDWKKIWGNQVSPLKKFGGGGLSGKILQPLVCEWITRLRDQGFTKPINGGGGILSPEDVIKFHEAGANSVFIGSVAMLRPWRIKSIINQANNLNWR